jgi:hypothetical protein
MRVRTLTYNNGITVPQSDDMPHYRVAKSHLQERGLYGKLNNFGPYTVNKGSRHFTPVEVIEHGGLEIHIVSTSVIDFSLNGLSTSAPRQTLEAWYMPKLSITC